MKVNGSRLITADGTRGKPLYRILAVSLLVAFVLAALPMGSVFAAPPDGDETENQDWENKIRQLRGQMAFFNNFQTLPGKDGNDEQQARYRDQYRAALAQAQSLMIGGGAFIPVTGTSGNGDAAGGTAVNNGIGRYYQEHPEKLLASYLHRMRKLREKMEGTSNNDNTDGNNGGTNTGTTGTP